MSALQKKVMLYAIALAYVVTFAVGVFLALLDESLTGREIASAIGLNLVASAIFATFFALIATRSQDQNLQATLRESFAAMSDQVIDRAFQANSTYLPQRTYPATTGFDPVFNRDMQQAMAGSTLYACSGPNPWYVPARLRQSDNPPDQVVVRMISPAFDKAVRRRVADRRLLPRLRGVPMDEMIRDYRDSLLTALVALFDCRDICPIDVVFAEDSAVTRHEICDNGVFIAWYRGPDSQTKTFPHALRFSSDALLYKTLRLDILRAREIADHVLAFRAATTEADLIAALAACTGSLLDPDDIARRRSKYATESAAFVRHLRSLR
ncbi:hypothetical protein [Nocardia xishanensis]